MTPLDHDLRDLMFWCLEPEKAAVREHLDDYRSAIVILITPGGNVVRRPQFYDEDEKIRAYSELVLEAKTLGATVIVTVNATRQKTLAEGEAEGYWWGKLEAESARDCISITASGPAMQSFGLDLAYDIVDGEVSFDPEPSLRPTEVGMLPEWPGIPFQRLN